MATVIVQQDPTEIVKVDGSTTISVAPPATEVPRMESGAGYVGDSIKYAREDHTHPSGGGGGGGGGGATVLVSETPPASVSDNTLWWENDSGKLFIRYADATGAAQWVQISSGAAYTPPETGAFAVNRNGVNQTLTASNYNKIIFNNEVRDQNGWYDPVLGRYTPQVAGLYFFAAAAFTAIGASGETCMANVYKNGVAALRGPYINISSSTTGFISIASGCLYMDGSTDYVEAWVYMPAGQTALVGTPANSHFEGFRVSA